MAEPSRRQTATRRVGDDRCGLSNLGASAVLPARSFWRRVFVLEEEYTVEACWDDSTSRDCAMYDREMGLILLGRSVKGRGYISNLPLFYFG